MSDDKGPVIVQLLQDIVPVYRAERRTPGPDSVSIGAGESATKCSGTSPERRTRGGLRRHARERILSRRSTDKSCETKAHG